MGFEDLPLSRPAAPGETPRRRPSQSSTSRWVIVGACAVVAGAALTLWWMSHAQPPAVIPAPAAAAQDIVPSFRRPDRQPMQLPSLVDSDAMIRELASTLSRNPLLARLVATRGIVRALALAVVQIGDGKTPATPLATLRPATRLEIAGQTSGAVQPASYTRWEAAIGALQSVPPKDAAQVYVNVKPLFDEAYRELGYPDGDFDRAIEKAIRVLDATPKPPQELLLLRREGYFEYSDAALQALSPVQKQLLLTGGANRDGILAWLHQFAAALEIRLSTY